MFLVVQSSCATGVASSERTAWVKPSEDVMEPPGHHLLGPACPSQCCRDDAVTNPQDPGLLTWELAGAGHYSKHISSSMRQTPQQLPLTDKEDSEKVSNLPVVTQQVGGRVFFSPGSVILQSDCQDRLDLGHGAWTLPQPILFGSSFLRIS